MILVSVPSFTDFLFFIFLRLSSNMLTYNEQIMVAVTEVDGWLFHSIIHILLLFSCLVIFIVYILSSISINLRIIYPIFL